MVLADLKILNFVVVDEILKLFIWTQQYECYNMKIHFLMACQANTTPSLFIHATVTKLYNNVPCCCPQALMKLEFYLDLYFDY